MNNLRLPTIPAINLVPLKQRLYRHWLLLLIPFGLVLIIMVTRFSVPPALQTQTSRIFIGHQPLGSFAQSERARQFNWLSSEFLVVSIKEWVNGNIFAGMVRNQLIIAGMDEDAMSLNDMVGAIEAESSRGVLLLQVSHQDEAIMTDILVMAERVLVTNYAPFIPQLNGGRADLTLVDRTLVEEIRPSLTRPLMMVAIRLFVALLAGVVLMLMAEYFEPVVYSEWELGRLGLRNMGEIPRR